MDKLQIVGGNRLQGNVPISGAKNSALKLMCCTLLTDEPLVLSNVPNLSDVRTLGELLATMGTHVTLDGDASAKAGPYGQVISFHTPKITSPRADYELVKQMRASINTLGPLLARNGYAEISLPGGCAIGARPMDLHLMALEQLGASVAIENGYIIAKSPAGGLVGNTIVFPRVTVGGTENAMCAAVLAKGETIISNAACEPEIKDLGSLLNAMGANIEGLGTETIRITGVEKLHGAHYRVIADRIETGTYAVAAAITAGDLLLQNTHIDLLKEFAVKLQAAGVNLEQIGPDLRVWRDAATPIKPVDIVTAPFPGLATDLQSPFMALMCMAAGDSTVTETIYENRFMHVPELVRLGANITIEGTSKATVHGVKTLQGAPVMATDLRASVALVLAGLVANGTTVVDRIYHLDRGYEGLAQKLNAVGANVQRLV